MEAKLSHHPSEPRLQSGLAMAHLQRGHFGPGIIRQGLLAANTAAVRNVQLTPDSINGEVQSRTEAFHQVYIRLDPSGEIANTKCTCTTGSWCSHAVTLYLLHAARRVGPELPVAPEPPPPDGVPATRARLQIFIDEHELHDFLERPAGLFAPSGLEVRWNEHGVPLGELLFGSNYGGRPRSLVGSLMPTFLAEAAARRETRDARAEAEAHPRAATPTVAEVLLQLKALRSGISAWPRLAGPVRVRPDPPTLETRVDPFRPCVSSRSRTLVEVICGAHPRVICDCNPNTQPRCPAAQDALERAIHALQAEDPATDAFFDHVARPPWARLVTRLDEVLAVPTWSDPQGRALGWQVLTGPGGTLQALPILFRPYKPPRPTQRIFPMTPEEVEDAIPMMAPEDAELASFIADALQRGPLNMTGTWRVLTGLAGHPRVFDADGLPIPVRRGSFTVHIDPRQGGGLALEARLCGVPLEADDLAPALQGFSEAPGVAVFTASGLLLGSLSRTGRRLLAALHDLSTLPPEAVDPLLSRVPDYQAHVPVSLAPELQGAEVDPDLRPVLRLTPRPDGSLEVRVRLRLLEGGPVQIPCQVTGDVLGRRGGKRVYVTRFVDEEGDYLRELLGHVLPLPGPSAEGDPTRWDLDIPDPETALTAVSALQDMQGVLQIEWTREALRVVRLPTGKGLKIDVKKERGWLQVGGGLSVEAGEVDVLALMAALRGGRRFVQVQDSTWVELTEKLRSALVPIAQAIDETGALPALSGGVLAGLADEGVSLDLPEELVIQHQRIREAESLTIQPPAGLRAEMRPYQLEGFRWLVRLSTWAPGACLADDMGLGKTLQALALLLHRSSGGAGLVVAPTSVGFNWVAEAQRFAPSLRVILYRGGDREGMLSNIGPGTLVVTSYDLLARDVDALKELRFHTLVLDEAQAIKNPGTVRARAARQLEVGYCVALTGTPLENRTTELWSLMRRVAPGLLGTEAAFRERFARPIEEGNDAMARASLARIITPFLLRRTKAQVATDLPPRTEQVVRVELSPKERRLYDAARRLALEGASRAGGADRMNLLASLTRLRQLACHPRLVDADSTVPSSKLEAAMELLNEVVAEGHKALVFSQFTRHLDLAEEAMREAGLRILRLQGDTPAEERQRRVVAFQAGEADVFLISLKAGGTGLNLTRATYVLHLDPWWNPAVEDQATDRAHRIGQQQPVTVYRFVTENTVEEAILKLHGEKRGLAADLLSGAAGGGAIRTDELIALLSGELNVRS